jgi:acyl carrier protein
VVRSRHLSPGYWRDELRTAERFSPPNRRGERTLRTGDLGRLDERGRLVVVGRRDDQVKVRGYRVELAEVEAALRSLPEVEAAATRAEPNRHGDTRLTAYVVPRPGVRPRLAELRDGLRSSLSEASVPTAFVFVDELTLNAHGKIDRERLAVLPAPSSETVGYAPPADELERKLCAVWGEALELEHVGRKDDFFDLGGDSLTAAEIGAGVLDRLGVEIDMRAFGDNPTVEQLAQLIRRLRPDSSDEIPLERAPRDGPLPCSFAQERILRFVGEAGTSTGYTMVSVTGVDGPVDLDALVSALQHVTSRYEPLRTGFHQRDGRFLQEIHPPARLEVPLEDLSGAAEPDRQIFELLARETRPGFDLENGPLMRFRLVRLGEDRHRLLRISHHLISDRRSWRIFFTELVPAYEAIRRGRPPPESEAGLQYADFAAWERRRLDPDGARYRENVAWWRHALEPAPPPLRLPFTRPSAMSDVEPDDGNIWWGTDPAVIDALDRLARDQGATHYAVRLALFAALLALDGDQDRVTIGAYVDTRRLPETQSMFGYFSNLVTLVLPFDPDAPFGPWLAKTRSVLFEAAARADLPYERLCEELRAMGREPPEVKAIFGVRTPMPELPFGMVEHLPPGLTRLSMPWGFNFTIDQGAESERCQAAFDATLYDPVGVRRFIDRYTALAEAVSARPSEPLGDLHYAVGFAGLDASIRLKPKK